MLFLLPIIKLNIKNVKIFSLCVIDLLVFYVINHLAVIYGQYNYILEYCGYKFFLVNPIQTLVDK